MRPAEFEAFLLMDGTLFFQVHVGIGVKPGALAQAQRPVGRERQFPAAPEKTGASRKYSLR